MHTVMITSPDFLEKNENVAEEVPLVLTCLLISVTFNVVPPPPMSRSMPLFVLLAIFHALTWDEFSPKSPHCLSRSLQANCALQLERERDKKNKRERRAGAREQHQKHVSGVPFASGRRKSYLYDSHLEQIT